jgi:(p)ppGpp synthase/HD superfamily hydrolase
MRLSARFDAALAMAASLHASQVRKGTEIPYISHLLAVAAIALEHGATEDEAIAALLHDAVEDQGGQSTLDRIRASFGEQVAAMVEANSDADVIPKPPWCERKERYLRALPRKTASARLVSAADKLHNVRSILAEFDVLERDSWSKFRGGRAGTLWYYGRLADAFLADDSDLSRALDREVTELERRAGVARATGPCPPGPDAPEPARSLRRIT